MESLLLSQEPLLPEIGSASLSFLKFPFDPIRSVLNVTFKLPLRFPLEPAKQLFKFDVLFVFRSEFDALKPLFREVFKVGDVANRLDNVLASLRGLGR